MSTSSLILLSFTWTVSLTVPFTKRNDGSKPGKELRTRQDSSNGPQPVLSPAVRTESHFFSAPSFLQRAYVADIINVYSYVPREGKRRVDRPRLKVPHTTTLSSLLLQSSPRVRCCAWCRREISGTCVSNNTRFFSGFN